MSGPGADSRPADDPVLPDHRDGQRAGPHGPQARDLKHRIGQALVPPRLRPWLRAAIARASVWPPVGLVRFGSLRRTTPIAPMWPPRYGRPIDRHYIEGFLEREAGAISGEVLEVGDLAYTKRFGGSAVTGASILHSPIGAGPGVTYSADLADAPEIPSQHFDCVILPQTLLFIYDVHAAVRTLHRILRPNGVLLVTVPGLTHTVPEDKEMWGQYWSFTDDSLRRLFGDVFGPENVEIESHGNVLTTTAFLYGLVVEDLRAADFVTDDPDYPLVLTVRATRAGVSEPGS